MDQQAKTKEERADVDTRYNTDLLPTHVLSITLHLTSLKQMLQARGLEDPDEVTEHHR